jgi:hypothetical protein
MDSPKAHDQADAVRRAAPRSAAVPCPHPSTVRDSSHPNPGVVSLRRSRGLASPFTQPTANREDPASVRGNRWLNCANTPRHPAFDLGTVVDLTNDVRLAPLHPPSGIAGLQDYATDRNRRIVSDETPPWTAPGSSTLPAKTPTENPNSIKNIQTPSPCRPPNPAVVPHFPGHSVARFVAHFVALSPNRKTTERPTQASSSTTYNDSILQQSTGRTAKITAPVATGSHFWVPHL